MKKFFSALGRGLLYAAIFVGWQIIVTIVSIVGYAVTIGFHSVSVSGLDIAGISQQLYAFTRENSNLIALIANVLALVTVLVILLARKRPFFKEIYLVKASFSHLWPSVLLGGAVAFIVSLAMGVLPIPEQLLQQYAEASAGLSSGNLTVALLVTVLVAPVTEEVFFRGLVYTRFREGMPLFFALLLESALFALMHGTPLWMAYAFLMAVLMTLIFQFTGSLWTNILFHMVFNYVGTYVLPKIYYANNVTYYTVLALMLVIGTACFILLIQRRKRWKRLSAPAAAPAAAVGAEAAQTDAPAAPPVYSYDYHWTQSQQTAASAVFDAAAPDAQQEAGVGAEEQVQEAEPIAEAAAAEAAAQPVILLPPLEQEGSPAEIPQEPVRTEPCEETQDAE